VLKIKLWQDFMYSMCQKRRSIARSMIGLYRSVTKTRGVQVFQNNRVLNNIKGQQKQQ
jgi:hypothetical protein